jgi:hypothetical protein
MLGEAVGAGVNVVGSVLGKKAKNNAANQASNAQFGAAQMGIDETRRQFDFMQELLSPFVKTGTTALGGMGDLAGLGGIGSQQSAINALQQSPAFTSQLEAGQNAILQNASATGGLRGGNTQAALAQFSPALLAQTINDQYSRLGGLAGLGQASAAGVGTAGMNAGQQIAGLLGQQGAAQAGNALARGRNNGDLFSGISSQYGQLMGKAGGF